MYVIQNKQFSLAHIAMVEWQDSTIEAVDPRDGKTKLWHGFLMHMSYNHVENMLFETERECKDAWEKLIDAMEAAGY